MRKIVSISLPAKMAKKIKEEVKKENYASVSEFFRDLIRKREEDKILQDVLISRAEIKAGKGKILRSLEDLD